MVDEELFKWYYRRIASGHVKKLAQAMDRGEIRRMDPELAAWCLMGANDYTGMRYILWNEKSEADPAALTDLFASGLTPSKETK